MTQQRPLIGILARHDKSASYLKTPMQAQGEAYLQSVMMAGGTPFIIPLNLPEAELRRLCDLADGILLTGGGDIAPELYGKQPFGKEADLQRDRDDAEILVSRWAADEKKPLLAICRGMQIISVAMGGELLQDLPEQKPEAEKHQYVYVAEGSHDMTDLVHDVQLSAGCLLRRILKTDNLPVNSMHHQAVISAPAPLEIVGWSSDGVAETVELSSHPFYVGVQWHPEELFEDDAASRAIFEAFVQACRKMAGQSNGTERLVSHQLLMPS